jgi:hypothetical protein
MRGYWLKIVLGALAIFGVGYGAVRLVRAQVHRVRSTIESTDPVSIPLAFLPFAVDGQTMGTFRGVTLLRSDPKTVSEIRLRVKLADSIAAARLVNCRVTTMNATGFSPDEGFRCLDPEAADSGLVPFGSVTLQLAGRADVTLPLLLDPAVVADLSGAGGVGEAAGEFGRHEAEAARAQADRIEADAKARADSIRSAIQRKVRTEVDKATVRPPKQD